MKIKGVLLVLFMLAVWPGKSQITLDRSAVWQEEFQHPSQQYAPGVFWHWMFGRISQEGLKADLEAMAEIGLEGAYLLSIKSPGQAPEGTPAFSPFAPQLSLEWWDRIIYTVNKADSLGLKLGFHICDGFALAGGPWITPELSMQRVVWSEQFVEGGRGKAVLATPEHLENYYRDIAVLALPVADPSFERSTHTLSPVITTNSTHAENDPTGLTRRGSQRRFSSREDCWVQYDFGEPFTLRSVEIMHAPYNYQAFRWTVTASDDGIDFYPVTRFESPRFGWQNNDAPNTFLIPATTARYFRMNWIIAGSEVGSEDLDAAKWSPSLGVLEMHLSGDPKIRQYEGKSGAVWRVDHYTTPREMPDSLCVDPASIVLLEMDPSGSVDLSDLPKGRWRILRMGHTSTGHVNETAGSGKGLECDKFNPEAVRFQMEQWFGKIYDRIGDEVARRTIKTIFIDSWECGSQNWSADFAREFQQRRSYDLIPYLPLYAGVPIGSAAFSEKVLLDIRQTIAELVVDVFYDTIAGVAKEYDCVLAAECVAPTMTGDGMMHFREVDRPMGEFWLRSPTHDKLNDMLDAIHGAHIYGKNIIQAEGFTQLRTMWDEYPGMLKTMIDRNYALGINKLFHHTYVHNPWLDKKPGMTLDGIGLYFQRDQTWWGQARAWIDYTSRCQYLLQQGVPVVDIAVFTGEDLPRRAVMPDRLLESLPGIFGAERVESERARLANAGLPLEEMPVGVKYMAGTTRPEDWIDPLKGYAYDSFNKDVLLKSHAEGEKMVLPGGASYSVVVFPLPDRLTMNDEWFRSEEVNAKIEELRAAGVNVLTHGEGLPYRYPTFEKVGVAPDLIARELSGEWAAGIAWNHRAAEDAEIYFLSNQQEHQRDIVFSLRSGKKVVEAWNPVNGECRAVPLLSSSAERTEVRLTLAPNESLFLVLKDGAPETEEIPLRKVRKQPLRPEVWEVQFGDGGPIRQWSRLQSWSEEADSSVRYFSGTASYRARFDWNGSSESTHYIDLGGVGVMAEVFVNGESCGIAWTPPYRVNVTNHLKPGANELRVEVVNTWLNRLIGVRAGAFEDSSVWVNNRFNFPDTLQESGLFGPVVLISE